MQKVSKVANHGSQALLLIWCCPLNGIVKPLRQQIGKPRVQKVHMLAHQRVHDCSITIGLNHRLQQTHQKRLLLLGAAGAGGTGQSPSQLLGGKTPQPGGSLWVVLLLKQLGCLLTELHKSWVEKLTVCRQDLLLLSSRACQ